MHTHAPRCVATHCSMSGEGGIMDVGVGADPLIVLGDELRERSMDEADGGLVVTREFRQREEGDWGRRVGRRRVCTRTQEGARRCFMSA